MTTAPHERGTAAPVAPRTLHAICELTRLAACDVCWGDGPQWPCAYSGTGPDGFHISRFAAALRRGLITGADFTAVIETAGVFTSATIVYDQTLGGRR
jgi:hypothetical protein